VREFLAATVLEHPAYSPNLAPNYLTIPEDKGNIKRKEF
jgi:hypothetical protein